MQGIPQKGTDPGPGSAMIALWVMNALIRNPNASINAARITSGRNSI
jgi:hypothetical protein